MQKKEKEHPLHGGHEAMDARSEARSEVTRWHRFARHLDSLSSQYDFLPRMRRLSGPLLGLILFGLVLHLLYRIVGHIHYHEVAAMLGALPRGQIAAAACMTIVSYIALTFYDQLGFRFISYPVQWRRIALASFIGCVFGNVAGNAAVASAAARYWIYKSFDIPAATIAKVVVFCNIGFWLGYFALGAFVFTIDTLPIPENLHLPVVNAYPIGISFFVALCAYLALAGSGRSVRIMGRVLTFPSFRFTLGQIGVATLEVLTMSAVLWILLPATAGISYLHFLQAFMLALVAGSASQIPGGFGVFETTFLLLLPPGTHTPAVLASLVAFRIMYFGIPLLIATALVAYREGNKHLSLVRKTSGKVWQWANGAVPLILAIAIFSAGGVLTFSGALPPAHGRLTWLSGLEPLALIETSHFGASLAGVAMLLLARGLQRRVDAAYRLSVILLLVGIVFSLSKGFDYHEALLLAVILAALVPSRSYFYRHASLFDMSLGWRWAVSIMVVLGSSVWLYLFSFKHIEYSDELWWRFALDEEAPRALRAVFGAVGLVALLSAVRLLRPVQPCIPVATKPEIEKARSLIVQSGRTYANLALRGDKALLFSKSGKGFLMYRRLGTSWIAMGDPVGPREEAMELVWQFRDLCDNHGGSPIFYEVGTSYLDLYLDLGLELTKLGEEARVPLAAFDLALPRNAEFRQARSKLARSEGRFQILAANEVPAVLPQLARISESWLAQKAAKEKGFSVASFDHEYLSQFPVAVVRISDEIVAFANVWLGAAHEEISIDLMRHMPDAPHGTMDFLFAELMLWGKSAGYQWFNLGMAPLSGLKLRAEGPLWNRFGELVYQYGEHFYNFQGLRHYKEKFNPVWSPRYLASPGGLALPRMLVDVTALVSGGFTGILAR